MFFIIPNFLFVKAVKFCRITYTNAKAELKVKSRLIAENETTTKLKVIPR